MREETVKTVKTQKSVQAKGNVIWKLNLSKWGQEGKGSGRQEYTVPFLRTAGKLEKQVTRSWNKLSASE